MIAEDCLKHCPKVRSVWELYIALLHRVLLLIVLYIALLHIVLSAGARAAWNYVDCSWALQYHRIFHLFCAPVEA